MTSQLISRIEPNEPSDRLREAVFNYVKRIVKQCCSCEVLPFGSVPLKTYLPDGDIDLTACSEDETLKNTWADKVFKILESEEKNENAEFHVKEVQYIQAEVKLIKCLVEGTVVDISFNQLGGLSTLNFLEEIDNLINHDHLFKRSIILVKAWCYYESRILGSHHGLISTYALEILVLYIFNVFNNSFSGPLEVLYRFLEFFSNFDWDNLCVSLWGPVPISSFPNIAPEPAQVDNGGLLLNKVFLDTCSTKYAASSGYQANKNQLFVPKHFNIVDPLRISNNLGRSVSKGNFFRIRSAFTLGAKRIARLLECPKEDLIVEFNCFFMNTWVRHGKSDRPDASDPSMGLFLVQETKNTASTDEKHENVLLHSSHEHLSSGEFCFDMVSHQDPRAVDEHGSIHRDSSVSDLSCAQSQAQKDHLDSTTSMISNALISDSCLKLHTQNDKTKKYNRRDCFANRRGGESRFNKKFSYDLAEVSSGVLPEEGYNRISSKRTSRTPSKKGLKTDDHSSGPHTLSHADAIPSDEKCTWMLDMQQEHDKNVDNAIAPSSIDISHGQVQLPINFAYTQFPVALPRLMLPSADYQQSISGAVPTRDSLTRPVETSSIQFYPRLISSPSAHYCPSTGLNSNPGAIAGPSYENFGTAGVNLEQTKEFRYKQDNESFRGHNDNGYFYSGGMQQNALGVNLPSSKQANSSSMRRHQNVVSGDNESEYADRFSCKENGEEDGCRPSSDKYSHLTDIAVSGTRKPMSESSATGSTESSKPLKDKRRAKVATSAVLTYLYGKSRSDLLHESSSDQYSEDADEEASPHSRHHELDVDERTQVNGPESTVRITPIIMTEQQNIVDNSQVIPFTLYTPGPFPFVMFPLYGFPSVWNNSQGSSRQYGVSKSSDNNSESEEGLYWNHVPSRPVILRSDVSESEILNSDLVSHWKKFQFGSSCENLLYYAPLVNQPGVVTQPAYSQGHFPMNGPSRPHSANINVYQQISDHMLVPVTSLKSVVMKDSNAYRSSSNEISNYCGPTGVHLPNIKVPFPNGHYLVNETDGGNYNYVQTENADGQGHRTELKPRYAGTSNFSSQTDNMRSRPAQFAKCDTHADRPWDNDRILAKPLSKSSVRSMPPQDSADLASDLDVHPVMASNRSVTMGPMSPVTMSSPHDKDDRYSDPAESLECGSLGPTHRHGNSFNGQSSDRNTVRGMHEQKHAAYKPNPSSFRQR